MTEYDLTNINNIVEAMMKRAAFAVIAFGLAVPLFAAAKHGRPQPQRLVSILQNGTSVTLRFEDGNSVDLAATNVRIRRASPTNQPRVMSIPQLTSMAAGGPLPAVAIVSRRYARIRVFENDAETRAFLQRAADRRAARESRTSKQ